MKPSHLSRSLLLALGLLTTGLNVQAAEIAPADTPAAAAVQQALSVNVNTANAEELADLLNGVGMSRAQAIIDFREQHGPFQSADDLTLVRGIGTATLERNRSVIRLK